MFSLPHLKTLNDSKKNQSMHVVYKINYPQWALCRRKPQKHFHTIAETLSSESLSSR